MLFDNWIFNNWSALLRVLVVGFLAYCILIFFLRISGKRTLSKMNAFDFVITVAIGSTLATVLLSKGVALVDGLMAFALLIFLQFAITWLSVRSNKFLRLIKAEPTLLYHQGNYLWSAMKMQRVNQVEILQAVRNQGIGSLENVQAVILETDGSFSVIQGSQGSNQSALSNVSNFPADERQKVESSSGA
jgi:uncharacterized membrane protein YcaP (DUF421 family)